MAVDTVHQCPSCELRFANRNELADHLAVDHAAPVPDDVPPPRRARGVVTVPVDPARAPGPALPVAVGLARAGGFAVRVVAAPAPGVPTTARYLAARVRDVHHAGVATVPAATLDGEPADGIVDLAGTGGTSLLCMATHARGAVSERVLGSVSAQVVRRSPVPVLLVGPGDHHVGAQLRRVIVGVDGSLLAGGARTAAEVLAVRLGVVLEIIQVVDPTDPASVVALKDPHAPLPDDPSGASAVLCDDDPVHALADRAGTAGDTILVVGTHGRTGFDRVALGSVALGLARHASGPVMVVPRGAVLDLDSPEVPGAPPETGVPDDG